MLGWRNNDCTMETPIIKRRVNTFFVPNVGCLVLSLNPLCTIKNRKCYNINEPLWPNG